MAGRPTKKDQALLDEICARVMSGRSLRDVTRDEDMPTNPMVYQWLAADPEFAGQYARATLVRADVLADQMFDIADTPMPGIKTKTDADGNVETTEGDMIEHRRLMIDTRKWALSKINPRKYGDKLGIGGADGLPPVSTEESPSQKLIDLVNGIAERRRADS